MYRTILFDLDGTLTDPGLGITNSFAYALEKLGLEVPDRKELYTIIGPPLKDCFIDRYGFSDEAAENAVKIFREYFSTKGLFENEVYEGIPEMLQKLRDEGKKVILATSKPEPFTFRILERFDLMKYFDFVAGATMDSTRVKKADVIAYALESCGITGLSEAVMIGDREHDIIGAKAHGMDSIGVLYGYGSREEHEKAGATRIAASVSELSAML